MPTTSQATATARTLRIWLLTNIGGTGWLVLDFCRDSPTDIPVPLIIGLMAALLSLAAVPLAIPFFALAQRHCAGWKCRLTALAVVLLGYSAGNYLLMNLLPIGPVSSLLSVSQPYLIAAVLSVIWLYRPRPTLQAARLPIMQQRRAPHSAPLDWSGLAQ